MTDAIQSPAQESADISTASADVIDSSVSLSGQADQGRSEAKSISDVVREKIEAKSSSVGGSGKSAQKGGQENVSGAPNADADAKPAYVPNYKYKVAGQERELEEFWRPLIKDAESEEKVKKLFSKVDAFDYMKDKKEHFESQYSRLSSDYDVLASTVDRFDKSVQSGDLSSAFRIAGIKKEDVYRWVAQQLKYDELPPEQRAEIEAAEAARIQKFEYEDKLSRMERQYQQQAVQTRTMQLDMVLMKPEVANFANAWDKNAEPGYTFRDTVAAEARRVYYETGQDLSPEQAVQMVMNRFGRFVSAGNTASPAPQAQTVTAKPQVPVIPNVSGKAASPIKKVPKSIDDLKAIAKSMA